MVDTNTAGKTAETDPTILTELTRVIDSIGVATPPTKEDSEQDYEDNANVTDRLQK